MAKASKKESEKQSALADKSPKKPARKAPEVKKPAVSGGVPLIDTGLAAQTAARLVAHRDELANVRTKGGEESTAFKQLKDSINKPSSQGPASFLQNSASKKKSGSPFSGLNQVGRNQTFGADVNRSGVPRRTGG